MKLLMTKLLMIIGLNLHGPVTIATMMTMMMVMMKMIHAYRKDSRKSKAIMITMTVVGGVMASITMTLILGTIRKNDYLKEREKERKNERTNAGYRMMITNLKTSYRS